ncbi:M3 family metallopeptidase [Williamsia sp. CHRR-6]|uniref:M3 family metallopeptidase n=1 Tax=Williamsia sp. CHRR-6 TaxID=2835871 RepID=UPI001BD99180|nr:M3 family metallopeptidase [Williamsia sp. CHRR-6]MBT0565400.1 M3 family metallopeptidase [Williamsia sp. CHRR-6]
MSTNPVLAPSPLLHGLPDFGAISDSDFLPAFTEAMAEHLREVDAIAGSPQEPTFTNTIEALERSGQALSQAAGIFYNLIGPDSNPERDAIAQELAAKLAAHNDAVALNPALFARIRRLHDDRAALGLDEPSMRLLERTFRDSVRAGAALDDDGQQQMREISARLSVLTTSFSQKVLGESNAAAVLIDDVADLDGLGEAAIAAAKAAAVDAGHERGYLLTLGLPTGQSALAALTNSITRRRLFEASVGRCLRGNEFDTRAIVLEIVTLRAQRAQLLGYRDHAEYVLAEQTAPDAAAVESMLADLSVAAMRAGGRELTRLRKLAGGDIEAWDMQYWLAALRRSQSSVPIDDFADYCELNTVLHDGVFHAAHVLYGLSFRERTELPSYHPDVRTWEVFDANGTSIGLYLGDFYARPSKRGGAWMNNIVDQSDLLATRPIIVNVLNVTKPQPGQPCLLDFDQLTTLFHEFGHTLHGLLSAVRYPSQSGTSVPRDFVEFPSQVNEMWALHPEVLANYARHHRTGDPIPAELAQAGREATAVETAYATIEYLAASVLDLAWHRLTADDEVSDIEAFEEQALRDAGVYSELIPPRYRTAYFNHIFGGGYAAGYYSYIWSEVLDAETEQWFLDNGGLTRTNGAQFADATLSRGDSVDPIAAHQKLLGRKARIEPLLRRRGLEVSTG